MCTVYGSAATVIRYLLGSFAESYTRTCFAVSNGDLRYIRNVWSRTLYCQEGYSQAY